MNKKPQVHFDRIRLSMASPETILKHSFGEVAKPETINYRTQRSERNGLFDEKIFGPDKNYECYCGKYKGIRYKDIICEKCGVEVTLSIVRRERMGHITLATPVAHVWFLKSLPSRIAMVLGLGMSDVERVVYFAGYIITKVHEDERVNILHDLDVDFKSKIKQLEKEEDKIALKEKLGSIKKEIESIVLGKVIDEIAYHNYSMKYGTLFEAEIGAEAIHNIFKKLDLKTLEDKIKNDIVAGRASDMVKSQKRLSVVRDMIRSGTRPEWMFLIHIPVIPPALRPMVPLDGGRYATSDVNDLYRRVINRNNRLKKLIEMGAPDVILRNEKRILQEAVDALIDNTIRHNSKEPATTVAGKSRELKSLADNLKGKRGLFRQNLLGKRVDYSGRSVIVVGPELKIHQCGLPKNMALELFKPFVISEILRQEMAFNIRGATRLIDDKLPEVLAILDEVIKEKYVLLNRAPTLHRLGIQAFQPVLIEGNAIQIHPLVCNAFNADFDGDTISVHLPLMPEAQMEAKNIMAADRNILKPGSGGVTIANKPLDIILGCFWMTKDVVGELGEGSTFPSPEEAILAYDFGVVDYRSKIKVLAPENEKYAQFEGEVFETTVGRILFNNVLTADFPFVNEQITHRKLVRMMDSFIDKYELDSIPPIMDAIKAFGFKYATISGTTWGIGDIKIPDAKGEIIANAKSEIAEITESFEMGLISSDERRMKNIETWMKTKERVENEVRNTLDSKSPVFDMINSGARGSMGQVTQMVGMKGLVTNAAGETLDFAIQSCNKEGLNPLEYFISTHGARKGMIDTALKTAKSGYLARKLFDVAQDVVVLENDCGTRDSIIVSSTTPNGMEVDIGPLIKGRFSASAVKDEAGNILVEKNKFINDALAETIAKAGLKNVSVRSPLTCLTRGGVCIHCYGQDLGRNAIVDYGEAVGTVAAQAIGEPGTQLTMRTFHHGGVASIGGDITMGLPRCEELFENRIPKNPAIISTYEGEVTEIVQAGRATMIRVMPDEPMAKSKKVTKKDVTEYVINYSRSLLVKVGDKVRKGQLLTDGSADLNLLFKYAGRIVTQNYIIHEVTKIYELQGEPVSRKHIEIIIRQMFSRYRIVSPHDTKFSAGDVVEESVIKTENLALEASGGKEAETEPLIMGITEISLTRLSFLSSASFQHTTRMLIQNALRNTEDTLSGLKENVIVGRLIPAGSGFPGSKKYAMIKALEERLDLGI